MDGATVGVEVEPSFALNSLHVQEVLYLLLVTYGAGQYLLTTS